MSSNPTSYCVKCRTKREVSDVQDITVKNGRKGCAGKCTVCGTKCTIMGKSAADVLGQAPQAAAPPT